MKTRGSGILFHIISLPCPYGIGDIGSCAYHFVDFLHAAKQRYWQILPINPTDGINGHSPYSCFSAFAGNTLLISPEELFKDGWIRKGDLKKAPKFPKEHIDYPKVNAFKIKLLDEAYRRFKVQKDNSPYEVFCYQNRHWLDDFALFVVAKSCYAGKCWTEWPKAIKTRQPGALQSFRRKFRDEIERVKFVQFLFFKQWCSFKEYCHGKGIEIIGDIPIYINHDSADVWCYPHIFKLNKDGSLKFVSGVPPDYFSRTGQRWGNPIFDWARLKKKKYNWWVNRIGHNLKLFDYIRIDHFRGFAGYWQIPAQERIAVFGRWMKGPGAVFFKTLQQKFPQLPIIAEDLGYITPDVIKLMKRFKFPGMRVLLFAFGDDLKTNPYIPENYPKNCVAYTGTHDNNTILGWFHHDTTIQEKENLFHYLGNKFQSQDLHWTLIKEIMYSVANTAVIPIPDLLGLGREARINTPATQMHNWQWRLRPRMLTTKLAAKFRQLTQSSKRV